MENNINRRDDAVFDIQAFSSMNTSHDYIRSNRTSSVQAQDYNYLSARDEIDSISRELSELHENLLKMSVRAHMLEVDLATQFNPDTVLDIRQLEMKCQECTQVVEKVETQIDTDNSENDDTAQEKDGNLKAEQECTIEDISVQ